MLKPSSIIFSLLLFILILPAILLGQSPSSTKYEALGGKIIGIWPHNDRFKSVDKIKELKERWGFEYILLAAVYGEKEQSILQQGGFDSLHTMYQIYLPDLSANKELFKKKILSLGKIWAYFFDEPLSREQSFVQVLKLISELSDNGFYPHGKFIVSEIDENKAIRFLRIADDIMYSGYGDKDKFGLDQVQTWTEWQKYLGNKFSMVWIGAHEDSNEYRTLFKAAHDLGINAIWLYALEPLPEGQEVDDSNFEKFCEAAVEFGFMQRIK